MIICSRHLPLLRGVGGTVASESALRSAGTRLSQVRAPLLASWPNGGPESLRSPCCGTNQSTIIISSRKDVVARMRINILLKGIQTQRDGERGSKKTE
ncbi:hypothetical protein PoB_001212900 [Plakobranchus ocellatus]|uniref:Uncharacterized protein n=1 Tax=Plakobranchus ocellatus TaxID=259542 RepID=A0AAV3YUC6_9GAST|nr:hypothetical protein PoB_001212900 [Plakobranchus ocellatus]